MSQIQEDQLSELNLQVDNEVIQHLGTAAKWSKFISVTVFIFCGIFLLAAIAASTAITTVVRKMSSGSLGFLGEYSFGILIGIILFVILIVGYVYYFLFNFSIKMKSALLSEDVEAFNSSLRSLKTFFIVTTIFSIMALLLNIYNLFKS